MESDLARDLEAEGQPFEAPQEPVDATRQHNSGARKDQLRKAHADMCKQEALRDQLQAQVKLINKQLADGYRKIKSDLGITRENFEEVRAFIQLTPEEQEAIEDQRREVIEALRGPEQLELPAEPPPTNESQTSERVY